MNVNAVDWNRVVGITSQSPRTIRSGKSFGRVTNLFPRAVKPKGFNLIMKCCEMLENCWNLYCKGASSITILWLKCSVIQCWLHSRKYLLLLLETVAKAPQVNIVLVWYRATNSFSIISVRRGHGYARRRRISPFKITPMYFRTADAQLTPARPGPSCSKE